MADKTFQPLGCFHYLHAGARMLLRAPAFATGTVDVMQTTHERPRTRGLTQGARGATP